MTKDEIRNRCPKVYLHISQNKIFANEDGNEYEFVKMFRQETYATERLRDLNTVPKEWEKFKGAIPTSKVVGFYLVPTTKIDDYSDWITFLNFYV